MAKELMLGTFSGKRLALDPRTKILLTVSISTVSIAGGSGGLMDFARPTLHGNQLIVHFAISILPKWVNYT